MVAMRVTGTGLPSRRANNYRHDNGRLIELIDYIPTASLKPYANHARRHAKDKIRRLRDNINAFGFVVVPLLATTW
jgi:hypothetical protein